MKSLIDLAACCLVSVLLFSGSLFGNAQKTILVTGGAGYIGSHTCKALSDAGFIPVTYDSLVIGDKSLVKWGPLVVGDLLDVKRLERVFEEYKPVAIIHLAGFCNIGEAVANPSKYYTNNVSGSINLLNMMIKFQVKNLVFSSSCTVYGDCLKSPISESCPQAPTNPYARSKFMIERIIQDYASTHSLNYMILRYFNAAGVDIESGLRRSNQSLGFLIPKGILAALHPDDPLSVFGTNYPTPDGTAIRDYIHVLDLARAHVLSLQYLFEEKKSDELNLGSGKGYSVLDIIQEIENVVGKKVPYTLGQPRKGDVPESVAEIRKAAAVLQFTPQHSDLRTMIESEWLSIQKHKQTGKDLHFKPPLGCTVQRVLPPASISPACK